MYLLLDMMATIAVNTSKIEAMSAVPKETLIKYSAAACQDPRANLSDIVMFCVTVL